MQHLTGWVVSYKIAILKRRAVCRPEGRSFTPGACFISCHFINRHDAREVFISGATCCLGPMIDSRGPEIPPRRRIWPEIMNSGAASGVNASRYINLFTVYLLPTAEPARVGPASDAARGEEKMCHQNIAPL